jgi:flagellar hook-associated protein 3 FlgL
MTRISTFAHSQTLLSHLMRNQEDMQLAQTRVSTGKKAMDFKGFAREANALLSARNLGGRIDTYIKSNQELMTRLELQNNALGEIADIADTLRQDLITSVNLNNGQGLVEKLEDHMNRAINVLSTRYNGSYVFGGTRGDTKPINVSTTADLLGLATTADAFDNNEVKPSQRVDDGRTMTFGVLAKDVAEPLLNAIRRILQFENGTLPTGAGAYAPAGSFQDPLTPNQRNFLAAEFSNAVSAIDQARSVESQNGVNMSSLSNLMERQGEDITFVKDFVGKIEQVDLAEAVAELKQGETALTASMQIIGRIGRLSLLDFI